MSAHLVAAARSASSSGAGGGMTSDDAWRDRFERSVKLAIDAEPGQSIKMDVEEWPGLRRAQMVSPITASMARLPGMLADGEDSVCLIINTGGTFALRQLGRAAVPGAGEAVLLSYREPAYLQFVRATYLAVRLPAGVVAPFVEEMAARPVPAELDAIRLLRVYLAAMPTSLAEPRLRLLAAQHVYDLVALATNAKAGRRRTAAVRAARLEAMKGAIVSRPSMTLAELAAQERVSERYVQSLFEEAGLTFSSFALDCRLAAAKAMLTSPRYDDRSVASIAYDAGFADLSYFNRRFRRRYQASPRELRAIDRSQR